MPQMSDLPWPDQAGQLRIFRCADVEVTELSATELAARFDLPAGRYGVTRSAAEKVTHSHGSLEVVIYRRSGGIRYRDLAHWQADHGGSVDLSDEDAVQIAQAFVERHELAPAGQTQIARVTRLRVGLADRDGTTAEERVIDVGVIFRRMIDGVPADGPGGHVMVYIGADGAVTGADRIWRTVAGVHSEVKSLRSREWLEERIGRRLDPDEAARLDVDEIRLGYFEQGWQTEQEFLQPAYVVLATLRSPDGRMRRRKVYAVPAASNDVGEIMPADKEVRTQPGRARQ